ncbi:MAG: ATP-grasp domain-containing protein [Proteobacteria bacterium]|nr:ATP-grasp domain-containing protein [Pseudomonadota bacterium]MDA0890941.1 ATP-grasp domain-containing protein [Pseudomonadota bacterium]
MNILISGIAGDIGFGAGRILRDWGWSGRLCGIDIQSEHPGEFVFDQHAVAPRAADANYLSWLALHIERHHIGLFIPTSEAEIAVLSEHGLREIAGARILIANQQATTVSLDKQACMSFLGQRGLRVPKNGIVGATSPLSYPVIVKPRAGQGSKQVQKIDDAQTFGERAPAGQVWQEYLAPDDQEYTCPVYHSVARGTHILVLRRTLSGGLTGRGEVVNEPHIEHYVAEIARILELDGAINVQLRLTADGPCLFEINPRLSSTLVFRDKMGFCDLRWWIQDTVGLEHTQPLPPYRPPSPGTRFFRGVQEYITCTPLQ